MGSKIKSATIRGVPESAWWTSAGRGVRQKQKESQTNELTRKTKGRVGGEKKSLHPDDTAL